MRHIKYMHTHTEPIHKHTYFKIILSTPTHFFKKLFVPDSLSPSLMDSIMTNKTTTNQLFFFSLLTITYLCQLSLKWLLKIWDALVNPHS